MSKYDFPPDYVCRGRRFVQIARGTRHGGMTLAWVQCVYCRKIVEVPLSHYARGTATGCQCRAGADQKRRTEAAALRRWASSVYNNLKDAGRLGPEWLEDREDFLQCWIRERKALRGVKTVFVVATDPDSPLSRSNFELRPSTPSELRAWAAQSRGIPPALSKQEPKKVVNRVRAQARALGLTPVEVLDRYWDEYDSQTKGGKPDG